MASLFVTEYRAIGNNGLPSLPVAGSQIVTISTAVSTAALGANTNAVGLSGDVGQWVLFGSSGSTAVVTSTVAGAVRIGAGLQPQLFNVAPLSRLTAIST